MVWDPEEEDRREEIEDLHYDVPAHLEADLWDWTANRLHTKVGAGSSHPTFIVMNSLRVPVINPTQAGIYGRLTRELETLCRASGTVQLSVIRILLRELPDDSHADELERRLRRGKSGYAVRMDKRGLEWRVPPAVREQVEQVVLEAPATLGGLLTQAWNEAYGIEGSAFDAYMAAMRATETALQPIISPTDGNARLNKMIKDYEAAPSKWSLVIQDARPYVPDGSELNGAQAVMQLARTIAYGQKARHILEEDENSLLEARAAVHLALVVSQLCISGAFRRVERE